MKYTHHFSEPVHQIREEKITQLVTATLGKKPGSIEVDAPLFSSQAGFDSFSLMELVLRLEEAFDIKIPDDDLDLENFQSINAIVAYLQRRLDGPGE